MQWYPDDNDVQEDGKMNVNLPDGSPPTDWKDIGGDDSAVSKPYRQGNTIYQIMLFRMSFYVHVVYNPFSPPMPYPVDTPVYGSTWWYTFNNTKKTETFDFWPDARWQYTELPDEIMPEGWNKSGTMPWMISKPGEDLEEVTFKGVSGLTSPTANSDSFYCHRKLERCNMLFQNTSFTEKIVQSDNVTIFDPNTKPHDLIPEMTLKIGYMPKAEDHPYFGMLRPAIYEILYMGGISCLTFSLSEATSIGVNPYYMMLPLTMMAFMQGGQTIFRKKR